MALSRWLSCSEPQAPHLQNGLASGTSEGIEWAEWTFRALGLAYSQPSEWTAVGWKSAVALVIIYQSVWTSGSIDEHVARVARGRGPGFVQSPSSTGIAE